VTLSVPIEAGLLLERDDDLERLLGAQDVALIEGAAGSGKSALLQAALDRLEGSRVLVARAGEFERDHAFGVVRRLFEPVLVSTEARERLLGGVAARAGDLVDGVAVDPGAELLHALYWLTANLAGEQPLVLVVDDLHWADVPSLRALDYLARRLDDLPVRLLTAMRPSEPGAPDALLDALRAVAVVVTPAPLTDAAVDAVVRTAQPGAGAGLLAAFRSSCAGNPLYLAELLRMAALDGWDAERVRAAAIPSLGDRVLRRVAGVGDGATDLAYAMAALDDGGRLAHAAALAGLTEPDASALAHRLRRIEVLGDEDPFAFVHPLVRRSLYDALPAAARDDLHVRAAALGGTPEAVATHLAQLRPRGSSVAAGAFLDAARAALGRAAPEAAERWLRRALDEGAPAPPRAELLAELGASLAVARDPESLAVLAEALELTEDRTARARIALDLAEIRAAAGLWEQTYAAIDAGLEAIAGHDDQLELELRAYRAGAWVYDPRQTALLEAEYPALVDLAWSSDGWAARALAAILGAHASLTGRPRDEAFAFADRAMEGGVLLAGHSAGGWASAQALSASMYYDDRERSDAMFDELREAASRSGSIIGHLTARAVSAAVMVRSGELVDGEAELRWAFEFSVEQGLGMFIGSMALYLADLIAERPSLDDLRPQIEAIELDPVLDQMAVGGFLRILRAEDRRLRGDRTGAVEDLRVALGIGERLHWAPTYAAVRSKLALVLPEGDRDEALRLAAEELELARACGLPRAIGIALRTDGVLRQDLGRLEEAVEVLAASPARLEHARAVVELGTVLRRQAGRGAAREVLLTGLELAHGCGAERLATRTEEELRLAGARPRRRVRTGVEALTPSELRVTRLVAAGRSNAEVAQELFLSLKTVETHLTRAYVKLDIAGPGARTRLAAALAA
jgi:DNA-binding CsgD family transcriptional regulator